MKNGAIKCDNAVDVIHILTVIGQHIRALIKALTASKDRRLNRRSARHYRPPGSLLSVFLGRSASAPDAAADDVTGGCTLFKATCDLTAERTLLFPQRVFVCDSRRLPQSCTGSLTVLDLNLRETAAAATGDQPTAQLGRQYYPIRCGEVGHGYDSIIGDYMGGPEHIYFRLRRETTEDIFRR